MYVAVTACLVLLALTAGCSNVIRAGLMNSNTVFLDPNINRTVYLQLRNTSENQEVGLNAIQSKLAAKGYQVVTDPALANYWIQAKVVYCHKAAEGVTPESVAKAGFGTGMSSGGTTIAPVNTPTAVAMPGIAGMNGPAGMDMNAMMRMAMSGGGMQGFPGMQPPPQEEGVTYLCVTDVQVADRKIGRPSGQPMAGHKAGAPKVQHMRAVAHVRQKELDIAEATPIIAEKLAIGISGLF